ncbi:MAG TPA: succinate dehydrogenase assembly factor 2 [Amaricoccus sp.]|nr:succinate dehydrogenase assembly factor 2 [Amaricoccus sp.]
MTAFPAAEPAAETDEVRLRRLRMRSWHRGIREMDLILGGFADTGLAGLSADLLQAFDRLLSEADHDLYRWIAGGAAAPAGYAAIVARIRTDRGIG